MYAKKRILSAIVTLLFTTGSYALDANKIQLKETPLENKHRYATWRVDNYICTAIAYAKSMGQSVEDFAKFVGKIHPFTSPEDQTISAVAKTGHYVMICYPGGTYEILSEADSVIIAKSNRPYKRYYSSGPLFGVTVDEFKQYFGGT